MAEAADIIKAFASELSSLVQPHGVMVRPMKSIREDELPVAVYASRNGIREPRYRDSYALAAIEFDVSVYSKSFAQLQEVKSTVTSNFHGKGISLGSLGSTQTPIQKSEVVSAFDTFDDYLEDVYRSIMTISIIY